MTLPTMKRLMIAAVALAGCWVPPPESPVHQPPPRTMAAGDYAGQCKMNPIKDGDGDSAAALPQLFEVTCPAPQGANRHDIYGSYMHPFHVAMLMGVHELAFADSPDPSPGTMRRVFVYASPAQVKALRDAKYPGVSYVQVGDVLTPQEYMYWHELADIRKEDDVYSDCKALVLNIDKSAADPARTQACSTAMAAIDRNRARRSEEKRDRETAEQMERERESRHRDMEIIQAELDHMRQFQELEARQRAAEARMRAIQSIFAPSPPPPPTLHCRKDYAGGMICN